MLRRMLPPPGPAGMLAAAQIVNSVGDGVYYVCSVLFFSLVVGLPAGQVAAGITAGWAVGMLASVPLGHLADRRGPRGTAAALAVATGLSIAAFLVVPRT